MLVKQESLHHYFHEFLMSSMEKQNIQCQDITVSYLSNLLTSFSNTENFIDNKPGRAPHKPLASYYSDAVNSPTTRERDFALQRLGDIALFISGFFSDSLNKKAVDIDYYVAMGGSAYANLSKSTSNSRKSLTHRDVFDELSNKFIDFVDVLAGLKQEQSSKNLLRTYEIWMRTQSKRAKRILIENGINPSAHSLSTQ